MNFRHTLCTVYNAHHCLRQKTNMVYQNNKKNLEQFCTRMNTGAKRSEVRGVAGDEKVFFKHQTPPCTFNASI